MTLLDHAIAWHKAGYTPVPITPDGQKRPIGRWAHLQHQQPDLDTIRATFTAADTDGIGLICGGPMNLAMLEVEGRALHLAGRIAQVLTDHNLGDLWERIRTGYVESSPSGGIHWYYRVTDGPAAKNTKLARNTDREVLIETRGTGGFTVIAPSAGRTHTTGKAWSALIGGPGTVAAVTTEEQDALLAIISTLDETPAFEQAPHIPTFGGAAKGTRPGDDYNARATWDDIIGTRGWTKTKHFGGNTIGWTRPGKNAGDGISATTGRNDGGNLYVFSSSTEFDIETPYTKFAAYCVAPETKVLMADCTWRPAGHIKTGDELIGIDEHIERPGGRRKLRTALVQGAERRILPCYRITLTDGRSITATDEHPWLASSAGGGGNMRWIQTQNLRPGQRISALTNGTWEKPDDYDTGWVGGMYDGEGWVGRTTLSMAQKPGPAADKAERILRERGFNVRRRTNKQGVDALVLNDLPSVLRALGQFQPGRLLAKRPWEGRGAWTTAAPNAVVDTTEFIGDCEVAAFMTSTRTFIAEGLISHNTLLEHNGDWSAAAKQLAKDGYGTPPPLAPAPPPTTSSEEQPAPLAKTGTEGIQLPDTLDSRPIDIARIGEHYGPTEDGTARALVHLFKDRLRYCPQRGNWLHWTGARWEWDASEHYRERIRDIARDLPDDKQWASYKRRALSAAGVTGIARLAQTDGHITVHIDKLDANPYELNTPGGIIDLRTGTLRPADPLAMHTRTTAIAPDFDNPSPLLKRFLATTFGGDQALIDYVQKILGVAAIGRVLEQILPFGHGSGANGKSTLLDATMHALGRGEEGYSISAPSEMLMVRKHSEHPAEIAQLAGARLVVCSELEEGARFAEARVKLLTGGDSINARFMRRDPFTFTPSHTFILLGNSKPQAATGGHAFYRRLRLIPFEHVVPECDRDPKLLEKLTDDAPALLAWIAQGSAAYLRDGLTTPDHVAAATAEYASEQDTVGRFLEERATLEPATRIASRDLRAAYEQWCIEVGETAASAKRLAQDLANHGCEAYQSHGVRYFRGVDLICDESGTQDDPYGEPGQSW